MKNICIKFPVFIFTLVCTFFYAQFGNLKVLYKYEYKTDSTNIYSIKDDVMALHILDKKSYFYSELKQKGDSALKSDAERGVDPATMLGNSLKYHAKKNSYIITKDFSKNEVFFSDKILNNVYGYQETFPNINWQLSNNTEVLLGYNCKTATGKFGNRIYKAWFCPDIPIADGPYKFVGLPGLILKVEDLNKNFSFTAISILKNTPQNIRFYNAVIPTTKKKYLQAKEQSIKNFVQYINTSSEVQIRPLNSSAQPKEKPYNPIE